MTKYPWQPLSGLAIGLLVLMGVLWVVNPTDGPFALQGLASAEIPYRYAAQPVGLDGPAGQCVVCHSIEKGGPLRSAPNLWGIVGAPKGHAKGYGYSVVLASASGVWTEKELNDYLIDPTKFMPGTKKTLIGLPNADERAKLIAFLATLKD
ncbi:MAG: c-type cytochrome [Candidatus Competibacteraceae bacterium]|nr:c-type cytochrome [Candidatus Competibacteraceae bacterium]